MTPFQRKDNPFKNRHLLYNGRNKKIKFQIAITTLGNFTYKKRIDGTNTSETYGLWVHKNNTSTENEKKLEPLQWHRNERDWVSTHQPHDYLLNRVFRRRSKKTSKLRVTGLSEVKSPVTGEFPAQRASNAENVSIWWRHHGHLSNIYMTHIFLSDRKRNCVSTKSMDAHLH